MKLGKLAAVTAMILLPLSTLPAADGAMLAKKCQTCHGVNYDKHALGGIP